MLATDKVMQKNENIAKKIKNRIYNYKMAAKKPFLSRDIKFPTKMGKPLSRRNFSLKFGS